jgi:DNA repair exonuclease SbcCD ATPase subunit
MQDILVPISPGELLDKITILRIKSQRMTDAAKLRNVRAELEALEKTWRDSGSALPAVADDETALQRVNEALWDIEDQIRDKELAQSFDAGFIELARAVYVTNDERAAIKKRVNTLLGSRIVEEKSYKPYRPGG